MLFSPGLSSGGEVFLKATMKTIKNRLISFCNQRRRNPGQSSLGDCSDRFCDFCYLLDDLKCNCVQRFYN